LGPNGETPAFDKLGKTSGVNFFAEPISKENAADNIELSDDVKEDLSNISTALNPNSPGDNRIALAISKIQHEKIYDNGQATIEEDYLKTIAKVGLEVGKATFDAEQSDGILAQTRALRERVSGVSIDEETANMVKFQHSYDASARVMRAADEMFQTVLGIKR
jgi:flagellar hook-associated protein 1 FlgK